MDLTVGSETDFPTTYGPTTAAPTTHVPTSAPITGIRYYRILVSMLLMHKITENITHMCYEICC